MHSLRSTSGATHADLLAAGTQPVASPHAWDSVRIPTGNSFISLPHLL